MRIKELQSPLCIGVIGVITILDKEKDINTNYEVNLNDENKAIKIQNKSLGLKPNINLHCRF